MNGWIALDASTRTFWRVTGRPVDLAGVHTWLDAPTSDRGRVEDAWLLEAGARAGGGLRTDHHLWLRRALVVRLHYRMERLA